MHQFFVIRTKPFKILCDDDGKIKQHYTLVDVYAAAPDGEVIAGDDADDAAWFEIAEIKSLGLWSETERIIFEAYEKWQAYRR